MYDARQFSHAIEELPINSLKPYPRNARRHSKAQIKQIAASIERFGFVNPVLTADDGEIVAGHGRIAAAKLLGLATGPCAAPLAPFGGRATRLRDRRQQIGASIGLRDRPRPRQSPRAMWQNGRPFENIPAHDRCLGAKNTYLGIGL